MGLNPLSPFPKFFQAYATIPEGDVVQVQRERWQHEKISFDETFNRLQTSNIGPGAFLVRDQDAENNIFTLCVLTPSSTVAHHTIQRNSKGRFTLDNTVVKGAKTLADVVTVATAELGLQSGVDSVQQDDDVHYLY